MLVTMARDLCDDDVAANHQMGEHGAALIPEQANVLTHCNTGSLATVEYGTALGVIRAGDLRGQACPRLRRRDPPVPPGRPPDPGSSRRMASRSRSSPTRWPATSSRAANVDLVIVGADRIAANGDVANKIGTYTLAVLCKENGIPFYVVAPTSTIDLDRRDWR